MQFVFVLFGKAAIKSSLHFAFSDENICLMIAAQSEVYVSFLGVSLLKTLTTNVLLFNIITPFALICMQTVLQKEKTEIKSPFFLIWEFIFLFFCDSIKGGKKLIGNGLHTRRIDLQYLSVIGEKSVGLIFDITDLCEHRRAKSFFDHGDDFLTV